MHLLILLAVALALAADPAQAAPVAGVVAAIGAVIAKSVVLTSLAQLAAGLVLSKIAQKLSPKPKGVSSEQKTDVKFEIEMGDDLPLSFILGTYATAGRRKYIGSWGRNTRLITQVVEVSCLPHPDIDAVWIGDEKGEIARGVVGIVSGDPAAVEAVAEHPAGTSGISLGHPVQVGPLQGRRRIWLRWVGGDQSTVDPFLAWAFGADPSYPWNGIGRGKSYAIVTVLYDREVMDNYPAFLFQPSPLPLYDPRKDGSTGGSGNHRWGNRATYQPTNNAAVLAYNVARGIYWGDEWIYGGRNLPTWRLPRAEWVAAMTACDRAMARGDGGSEPAYRAGAEVHVDRMALELLQDLGRAANMRFAEVGGQLKPCVDLPGSAVFSISDEDVVITAGQSLTPFFPLAQTYNALSATYPEPAERWAMKDAPQRRNTSAEAQDGGRYLPTSLSYPVCPFGAQVQRLMTSQLADYRRMRQPTITLPPDAYALEPLDMISWTSAHNGYVEKKFVVEQVTKLAGFNVSLALREVDPSDYDWQAAMELPQIITTPVNPIPLPQGIFGWTAQAVVLTDDNGKDRKAGIRVSCGSAELGVSEIRIQVERAGSLLFDVTRPYAAPHVWTLTEVTQEATYRVRGALISRISGEPLWSDWITVVTEAIPVELADLSAEILAEFDRIAGEVGITTVALLPPSGSKPDQLVMLQSSKQIYRWDAVANDWSTDLFTGLADSAVKARHIGSDEITSNHIAAQQILAMHVAAGTLTADRLNVISMTAAGLSVFGGALQSQNYVAGNAGWRINQNGNAEFNSLQVRRGMIVAGAVSATFNSWSGTFTRDNTDTWYHEIPTNGNFGDQFAAALYGGNGILRNPIVTHFSCSLGKRTWAGSFQIAVLIQVAPFDNLEGWRNLYGDNSEWNALYLGTTNNEGGTSMATSGFITNAVPNVPFEKIARIRALIWKNAGEGGVIYQPRFLIQQVSR